MEVFGLTDAHICAGENLVRAEIIQVFQAQLDGARGYHHYHALRSPVRQRSPHYVTGSFCDSTHTAHAAFACARGAVIKRLLEREARFERVAEPFCEAKWALVHEAAKVQARQRIAKQS